MQGVRRAVRFERPDFHFTETLAAELRFTAQRLLGDERVRAGRTRVNLVVFRQVGELQRAEYVDFRRAVKDRRRDMNTGDIRLRHAVFIDIVTVFFQATRQIRIVVANFHAQRLNRASQVGF